VKSVCHRATAALNTSNSVLSLNFARSDRAKARASANESHEGAWLSARSQGGMDDEA